MGLLSFVTTCLLSPRCESTEQTIEFPQFKDVAEEDICNGALHFSAFCCNGTMGNGCRADRRWLLWKNCCTGGIFRQSRALFKVRALRLFRTDIIWTGLFKDRNCIPHNKKGTAEQSFMVESRKPAGKETTATIMFADSSN